MPMTLRPTPGLAAYIAQAPAVPVDKDRSEVRVYATIITAGAFVSFAMTAIWIWFLSPSLLRMVVDLTGHPGLVAFAFVLLGGCMVPHLLDLMFRPARLREKLPRKIAARSMVFAAVLWGMLAHLARPLDVGVFLPLSFWVLALAYMLVGGAYGYSLNAQLASEHDAKKSEVG